MLKPSSARHQKALKSELFKSAITDFNQVLKGGNPSFLGNPTATGVRRELSPQDYKGHRRLCPGAAAQP